MQRRRHSIHFCPSIALRKKGVALFNLGKYKEAISALDSLAYQTFRSRGYVSACAIALGDKECARKALAEAISISPDLTASKFLKAENYRYPEDAERLRKLLIAAGLPE